MRRAVSAMVGRGLGEEVPAQPTIGQNPPQNAAPKTRVGMAEVPREPTITPLASPPPQRGRDQTEPAVSSRPTWPQSTHADDEPHGGPPAPDSTPAAAQRRHGGALPE
jgi:hypothetical protein